MRQPINQIFEDLFGSGAITVRSPGRINLIGEHTDYNLGFVMPAAIDKEILFALGLNQTRQVNLYAVDVDEHYSFSLDQIRSTEINWVNYIMGCIDQVQKKGIEVEGFNCVFGGNIPLGAGMSSSAAIECGIIYGLSQILSLDLSKLEVAKMGQAAEMEMVGVQCGLMDQYANMFGKKDHLLHMDCREETHKEVPVDLGNYGLWLFNTNVKHSLGESEYNVRRSECESGVAKVKETFTEVTSLRDCTKDMLNTIEDPVIQQRCRYVVEENQRVVQGVKDLSSGNLQAFGDKMYQSHSGLSEQYQVSCKELDLLVNLTRESVEVLGARMMGGGFGGCTINLIKKEAAVDLISRITLTYKAETSKEMSVYAANIANGTSLL